MKSNGFIKVLFVMLYSLYILVMSNTRLIEQIVPYGNLYVYFYVLTMIALLFGFHFQRLLIRTKMIWFQTVCLLSTYIAIFSLITYFEGAEGDLGSEVLSFTKYIVVAAITIYFVQQFGIFSELLFASFIGGSLLVVYEFALAGYPLDVFTNLENFFSNTYALRFRMAFNFNNFNTVGNIASCLIVVYFLLVFWAKSYEKKSLGRTLKVITCTAVVAIDVIVMLSSGSRNAMLTLLIFALANIGFKISEFQYISEMQKKILKTIIIAIGSVAVYFNFFSSSLFEMFETSGRLNSFKVNIPLVISSHRFFEGLGLMNPGLFGRGKMGYIVDNYYLYVFMETGIIGLAMITFLLIRMGKRVRQVRMTNKKPFFTALSSAFIAWLASGMGETCIIYPYFASSLIFFVIFLAMADYEEKTSPIYYRSIKRYQC